MEEPDHLLCPIMREMFRDPVMLVESGHTYEREAIERHLRGSEIDPRSNVRIGTKRVVSNWTVRNAVQAWLAANPGSHQTAGIRARCFLLEPRQALIFTRALRMDGWRTCDT